MPLHGVGTWLARLGKMTEQVAKRRRQGRASACCERTAGVLVVCNGERLKKTVLTHLQRHKKTWLYWRGTAGGPHVFVAVFVIVAHSQFFMAADLSVGAVKHSGVFSCDWDSLEEESVRHGAWLCVCWSSSGGLGECGR